MIAERLGGTWETRFSSVAEAAREIALRPDTGFGVAVHHRGRAVVDLWAGRAGPGHQWNAATVVQCFSATKAVSAAAAHWCIEQGALDLDAPIAAVWPAFAAHGKESVTLRHVLAHRSGLHDVLRLVADDVSRLTRWEEMVVALERAAPDFVPGSESAYQAVTYGFLVGETVRRATGRTVADIVAEEFARPLGLEGFFVPLPESARTRNAPLPPAGVPRTAHPSASRFTSPTSGSRAESMARSELAGSLGNRAVGMLLRDPSFATVPMPATHGFFTALDLSRFYAMFGAGGSLDGVRVLDPATVATATTVQSDDRDRVMQLRMFWRLGFHRVFSKARVGRRAFGHNGFGGSTAWADPTRELSFAFVTNALSDDLLLDQRALALGDAAIRAADVFGGDPEPLRS